MQKQSKSLIKFGDKFYEIISETIFDINVEKIENTDFSDGIQFDIGSQFIIVEK